MTESVIHKVFPDAEIKKLLTNDEYGFDVLEVLPSTHALKLITTSGLSNHKAEVPDGSEEFSKVEVMFVCPEYFNLENMDWPVHWINRIAQVPQKFNTWFGAGDTIPAGNPPEILHRDFATDHFIVSRPIELEKLLSEKSEELGDVSLLSIIPIFKPELDFKMRNSGTALIMRIQKKGYTDLVDVFRTTVCRKRILGF